MAKTGIPVRRTMNFDRVYKVAYNKFNKEAFIVTLHAGDGSGKVKKITLTRETGYEYSLPKISPLPIKDGYVFIGWSFTPDGTLISQETIMVTEDVDLYAVCQVTVTLNPNNGIDKIVTYQMKKGTIFGLPEQIFQAPPLKAFAGWSYTPKGLKIIDVKITVNEPVTLYPRWLSGYDGWVQLTNYAAPTSITDISELYAEQSAATIYKLPNNDLAFWNSIEICPYQSVATDVITVDELPELAPSDKIYILSADNTAWHFECDVFKVAGAPPQREDGYWWAEQTLSSVDAPRISNSIYEVFFNKQEKRTLFYNYLTSQWEKQNDASCGLVETALVDYYDMDKVEKKLTVDTDFYKITFNLEGFQYWCWARLVKDEFFTPTPPRLNELTYYAMNSQNQVFIGSCPLIMDDMVKQGAFNTKLTYGAYDGPFIRAGIAHQITEVTVLDDIVPVEFSHYFDQLRNCVRYNGMEHVKLDYCTVSTSVFAINNAVKEINGIEQWNTSNLKNMAAMFQDCQQLTSLDLSRWETKNNTALVLFFSGCRNLQHIYVGSGWSTEKVTDNGDRMFRNCSKLPNWDGTQTVSKAHYGPGGYLEYKEPTVD